MELHEQMIHERFMRRALDVARQGWGTTHPNPMVGAVIVEQGEVVAEGFHEKDGEAHAEIMALHHLGRPPRPGAVLYVTLEPCSTEGRTGACTAAIITAGITHVVVGAVDPNPVHAGHGFEVLRAAGVQVTTGVLADDCADLNLIFNHWIMAADAVDCRQGGGHAGWQDRDPDERFAMDHGGTGARRRAPLAAVVSRDRGRGGDGHERRSQSHKPGGGNGVVPRAVRFRRAAAHGRGQEICRRSTRTNTRTARSW